MIRVVVGLIAVLYLVGCSSLPKVQYGKLQEGDYEGKVKFNLSRSLIKVDLSKCGKDDPACERKVEAVSLPTESEANAYIPNSS